MSRDPSLYLEDLLESCRRIEAYTEGRTREAFEADQRTVDAVAWNLGVVGEAVKGLPGERKRNEPSLEWRKIAGFRDVLVHGYVGLDHDIVGDIVENKLDDLAEATQNLADEAG